MNSCPTCDSEFVNGRNTIEVIRASGHRFGKICPDPWHEPPVEEILLGLERKLDAHIKETYHRLDVILANFHPRR